MICPNCQTENPPGSRFCMECGTRLLAPEGVATGSAEPPSAAEGSTAGAPRGEASRASPRPVSIPPAVPRQAARTLDPTDLPPTHPEWRMSPAGPLPEQPRRRWVVWLVGAFGACLLVCVALYVWLNTIGEGTLDSLATQVSVEATRQAGGE